MCIKLNNVTQGLINPGINKQGILMEEFKFNDKQLLVLEKTDFNNNLARIPSLFEDDMSNLSLDDLLIVLKVANALYRAGVDLLSDQEYNNYINHLDSINPDHEFLNTVEPEVVEGKTVTLPKKMLSTDKAYSFTEVQKWTAKIIKFADELGISREEINIRVTPKLDGFAAYDDAVLFYTRGNGYKGQDISRAFDKGLIVAEGGDRGLGPGEIVIRKSYFDEHLADEFENSRNIQSSIIAEKQVEPSIQLAIDDGACVFYPFSTISNHTAHYLDVLSNFEDIVEKMWTIVDYNVDGVIFESTNEKIKEAMGSNRKHHRWQIAFKINDESAQVPVLGVTPQTSRSGRITPVAELEPTKLSGATLSRATCHHYRNVKSEGIGPGAIIELVRSGLVIPKLVRVITPSDPDLPTHCPSCGTEIIWEGDHIVCPNKVDCPAQTENTLIHFFKTLGNNDGFGPKVIETLHARGINKISEIYALTVDDLVLFGFGQKTAQNLIDQLVLSREVEIEDWRFLSAFGISRLGGGNSERLLSHHPLSDLFKLSENDISSIDRFGKSIAKTLKIGFGLIEEEYNNVFACGFKLKLTPVGLTDIDSPIAGLSIVFTGTMVQGKRDDMIKEAKALGAKVGKSVSSKTDYLVAGLKVGQNKTDAAKSKGVQVISEQNYLDMIT
jgi:DNA ligase (NAD+)